MLDIDQKPKEIKKLSKILEEKFYLLGYSF